MLKALPAPSTDGAPSVEIDSAIRRFVATIGALRLEALKQVPPRALALFPDDERARFFGALDPDDRVVVIDLVHLAGANRGERFSVGLILALEGNGGRRVARLFDAVPMNELIDRMTEVAS